MGRRQVTQEAAGVGIIDTAIDTAAPTPAPAPPGPTLARVLVASPLLALLALAGNHFSLSLFFGVDVLFGSIAVLLALVWLGTWPGLVVALVGGAYTWFLWDHPYAMIILVGEAAAVAWHRERARRRGRDAPPLAVSVTLYWLLIGVPLVLLCYHWGLGMGWPQTLLVAVKQALNGILDAALAGLVLLAAASLMRRRASLPVAQVLFSVLLSSLLLPSLLMMAWQSGDLKDHLEVDQVERLLLLTRPALDRLGPRPHPDGPGAADLEAELQHLQRLLGDNLPAGSDPRVQWSAPPGPAPAGTPPSAPAVPASAHLGKMSQREIGIPTGTAGLEIILPSGRRPSRMTLWREARYRMEIPRDLSSPGGQLAVEVSAAPLIDRMQETVTRLLLVLLALAGLGVALARALSRQLVRPLQQLLEVTTALPAAIREDRPWPVPRPGRLREPGQLAVAVAAMAGSLSASFRALAQENLDSMRLRQHLQRSQARLAESQRIADMGSWYLDIRSNEVEWSDQGYRLLGYAPGAVAPTLGNFLLRIHPRDRVLITSQLRSVLAGEALADEHDVRVCRPNGDERIVHYRTRILRDPQGQVSAVEGVSIDVTERRRAESALHESEQRFRNLFENMAEGVVYQDADGAITNANAAALRMLGLSLDELKGRRSMDPRWQALHEDGTPFPGEEHPTMLALRTGVDTGETVMGVRNAAANALRWLLVHACPEFRPGESRPYRAFATFSDITGLKQTEQGLLKAQEIAMLGSWELDLTADRLSWSPEALRIYEQAPDQSATSYATMLAAMHPQDRALVDRAYRDSLAARTPYDLVHRLLLPDGRIKWVQARCETEFAPDGSPLHSRGTVQDITARKEAELALDAERQRLSNIIAGTRIGTWEWEVQTGVTAVNERWAGIVGYHLADLAPISIQTWIDLTHPDDLKRSLALAEAHYRGESDDYECELRMRHRDGHWVWVLDQGRVTEWDAAGAPRLMSGIHQDITERKHAESALAQRESMVDELLALAVQLVGVPDQGLDTLTEEAIERIGRFANADRSYVGLLDEAAGTLTNTREWTAQGVAPGMAQNQSIPLADLPELMLQLRLGEPVVFPRVTDIPADWSREQAICVARGTASLLIAPLAVGEALLGCVGLEAVCAPRDWSSAEVRFLQVFASILAGVMDRAHATQDLRASNARYEQLARQSRSMSWEIDPQGRYTYVSPVCEQVLGYRAEELIGNHFYDLLPADDRAAITAAAFAIMERREPIRDFDRLCLGVQNWRVWLMSSGAPLFAPDGSFLGYRGIDTDITDRHLAQDLIRESEARLSAVFENAPIGMALIAPDRRFTLVNRALAAFLGRSPGELTAMRIDDVTAPDDLDRNLSMFTDLQAGRQSTYRITKHYLRPDGRVVWGDVRVSLLPSRPGTPSTPLATIEDITDLHAAADRQRVLEDALTRYAAQLEDLVDLINRALPSADKDRALLGLGCRTLGAAAAVLGQVQEDGGHRVLSAIPDEGADGPQPAMPQAVLAEILAHRDTLCLLGAEHLAGAAATPGLRSCIGLAFDAPRPDGPPETLILSLWGSQPTLELAEPERQLIRLIAQRMAAERYQEQIQRDLAASRVRETIGHLASGIAHDFNNLLGVIDANIYFLEIGLPADTDPEIRQVLEETQSALGQAKVITSGMLSLSRAGGVPLEPVDLERTVAELVRILRQVLPPGIHLTVGIPPGLKARTNAAFLQAALLNLALNARDAMPMGGVLQIAAAPLAWTGDTPLAVGTLPPMDCVELRVTDSGSGIAPAILPRIFEPLFSTKAKQRGHGLGLFMVQEFISRSGAGLAVESAPGCGTSFRLLLAAVTAQVPEPGTDPRSGPLVAGAEALTGSDGLPPGLRILVVDDDPRVREAVVRLLSLDGVDLGQAEHGQAALALLAQDPGFDLVLSDIAMPALDGIGLYRHLSRERPELPVILMTGQDSSLANGDDLPEPPLVLRKPLDPATLRAAIRARVRPVHPA